MANIKLYLGDALARLRELPSDSVHLILCSPPYFGLRDYGVEGQLGLERTWTEHIEKLVEIFTEAKRVLHPMGTLFINYGDSYATGAGGARKPGGDQFRKHLDSFPKTQPNRLKQPGFKAKDLMGMPWRLAIALLDSGWWLRSDIIWCKTNAISSSVIDRPSPCHEYVFMLAKSKKYFWDKDGTRILTGKESTWEEYAEACGKSFHEHADDLKKGMLQKKRKDYKSITHPMGKSLRSVWSIATERGAKGHHASFPKKLVEPIIRGATSERGCCPICLAPWVRIYEEIGYTTHGNKRKRADTPGAVLSPKSMLRTGKIKVKKPVGWKQSCKCAPAEPVPCIVLDPFSGTATTGVVARRHNRDYWGIELSPEYFDESIVRLRSDLPLLNSIEAIREPAV